MEKYLLTICIPTYNRPNITLRLIANLPQNDSVEYLVIDDGSTQKNLSLLKAGINANHYPIQLLTKKNGGKLSAVRFGLPYAKGKYYMDLDSDDWITEKYLDNILSSIKAIQKENALGNDIVGTCGLCVNKKEEIIGSSFFESPLKTNYLKMRYEYGIKGDKEEIVLTESLRNLDIPFFQNEKSNVNAIQWVMQGKKKFLFVNKIFSKKNIHCHSQLTDDEFFNTFLPSKSHSRFWFKYQILLSNTYNNLIHEWISTIQYLRFSFHGVKPFIEKEILKKRFFSILLFFPFGLIIFIRDFLKIKIKEGKKT